MCTGGSIENILDNIGASCESLSSLIPQEKRTELVNFEMNLKHQGRNDGIIRFAAQLDPADDALVETVGNPFLLWLQEQQR